MHIYLNDTKDQVFANQKLQPDKLCSLRQNVMGESSLQTM